jgi:hypothetical protein
VTKDSFIPPTVFQSVDNLWRSNADNPVDIEYQFRPETGGKKIRHEFDTYDLGILNASIEPLEPSQTPEHEMVLHLIGDAIACLKDKWVTKAEKVEAFNWIFAPSGPVEPDDDWSLDFWCELIDVEPAEVQAIATVFMMSDLHYANRVRFWW